MFSIPTWFLAALVTNSLRQAYEEALSKTWVCVASTFPGRSSTQSRPGDECVWHRGLRWGHSRPGLLEWRGSLWRCSLSLKLRAFSCGCPQRNSRGLAPSPTFVRSNSAIQSSLSNLERQTSPAHIDDILRPPLHIANLFTTEITRRNNASTKQEVG